MPLNEEELPLPHAPRAAAEARRWVTGICTRLHREDLVECAELGVSELVSNAILHGAQPVAVRMRGTASHPRIEVMDGSSEPPVVPAPAAAGDDYLTTYGRGLSMVALSAVAWGASIENHGKVVWFEPATGLGEGSGGNPVIDSDVVDVPEKVSGDSVAVELVGIDVELFTSLSRQYTELRRELRLLAVAHQESYPTAADLSAMFASFDRQFPRSIALAVEQAREAGKAVVHLKVQMDAGAAGIVTTMLEMFDLADAFCKAERLLTIQRTPQQRAFHVWYLGEFVRQLAGEEPLPWPAEPTGDLDSQHVS